eukprot:PRCOL_00003170-RA
MASSALKYQKELKKREQKRNKQRRQREREERLRHTGVAELEAQLGRAEAGLREVEAGQQKQGGAIGDVGRLHALRQQRDMLQSQLKRKKEVGDAEEGGTGGAPPAQYGSAPHAHAQQQIGHSAPPRAEDSVYYHPQLNPTGAPPPGKAWMYRTPTAGGAPSDAERPNIFAPPPAHHRQGVGGEGDSDSDSDGVPLPPPDEPPPPLGAPPPQPPPPMRPPPPLGPPPQQSAFAPPMLAMPLPQAAIAAQPRQSKPPRPAGAPPVKSVVQSKATVVRAQNDPKLRSFVPASVLAATDDPMAAFMAEMGELGAFD